MGIAERIALVIKMHNLTNSSFADKIGVQRSNISHITSGRSKPGLDFLERVLLEFPRVNADWLITGRTPDKQETTRVENELKEKTVQDSSDTQDQPEVEIGKEVKSLVKVLLIYSDNTFDSLSPSEFNAQ
jgi:transcriptional regulator with XRE-family HTH domain